MNIYMYNPKTRLLHILGYCKDSPAREVFTYGYKYFKSENEAIAYAGRQVGMCINCANKRDKILGEDIQKKLLR